MNSLIEAYESANKNFSRLNKCTLLVNDSLELIEKAIREDNGKSLSITVNLPHSGVDSTEFRIKLIDSLKNLGIVVGKCVTNISNMNVEIKFISTEETFFKVSKFLSIQELSNFCGDKLRIIRSPINTYRLDTIDQGEVVLQPGDVIAKDYRGYRVNT